jgi:hypothetical protein
MCNSYSVNTYSVSWGKTYVFINWAVDWAKCPASPSIHLEFWEENRVSTGYDTELYVVPRIKLNPFVL